MSAWDTERAAELARKAYRYVLATYPELAPLEPLGYADMAVLEAQEAGDFEAYEEVLRELCRVARREAAKWREASRALLIRSGGGRGVGS